MAASSSLGERRAGRWGSPERTVVWTEPNNAKAKPARKVAVVYYLCHRDGHLDHPHFLEMELPLSSSSRSHRGLYLRDFTARLTALRGGAMASAYSWSAKRSYRSGYVWQDLGDDDLIHPAHASDEYVLKGSPLLLFPQLPLPPPPSSSSTTAHHQEDMDRRAGPGRRRRNGSSFDLGDSSNLAAVAQQCAATQTDGNHRQEVLGTDEISPPPSSSSPDDGPDPETRDREAVGVIAGGRMRASAVLMQLFSCGSMAAVKRPAGHARRRSSDLDRMVSGSASNRNRRQAEKEADAAERAECLSGGGGIMDRDYFSGSLVESSKTGGGGALLLDLKRSSSCNAERGAVKLKLPVAAKEARDRAGCLASRAGRDAKKNTTRSTVEMEVEVEVEPKPTAAGSS